MSELPDDETRVELAHRLRGAADILEAADNERKALKALKEVHISRLELRRELGRRTTKDVQARVTDLEVACAEAINDLREAQKAKDFSLRERSMNMALGRLMGVCEERYR